MGRRRGPGNAQLSAYLARGFTHQEIADDWYKLTGERVTREAISSLVHRAGLSKTRQRYDETVPWQGVSDAHGREYPVRMLRALGRRLRGLPPVEVDEERRLDHWLEDMRREGTLVAYVPGLERGFWYVAGDWPEDGIPIVREPITTDMDEEPIAN